MRLIFLSRRDHEFQKLQLSLRLYYKMRFRVFQWGSFRVCFFRKGFQDSYLPRYLNLLRLYRDLHLLELTVGSPPLFLQLSPFVLDRD